MSKKVLIYFPKRKLAPTGGPAGYLNNLYIGLKKCEHHNLDISFYENSVVKLEENQYLRNVVPKRIKEFHRAAKFASYLKKEVPEDMNMNQYDAIHFHRTEDMYLNRKFLATYQGKVILTSHTPCVPYQEIIGRLNPIDYKIFKKKIDDLVEMDKYAFQRADFVIFPCQEAEEPYYHTWKEYSFIRDAQKYRYLPTGIKKCYAKETRQEYRKKYNIPEDAFVISYVGRHNKIKGYEDLKRIGEKLLSDKKYIFLIGGKEEPMEGLKNERWIEIGWTSDPYSLIAASDLFILPNQETYFDLILLEVISLGIPVLMSDTGGNKFFSRFNSSGLENYKTLDDAIKKIEIFKELGRDRLKDIGKLNEDIFDKNFTVESFAVNYINMLNDILKIEDKIC